MKSNTGKFEFKSISAEELENIIGGSDINDSINNCYSRARADKDGAALQACLQACTRETLIKSERFPQH